MASDLPDLLKRLDASVTHLTHVFVPLVTSLVDDPTILASPEGANIDQQALHKGEEQLAADQQSLTTERTELDSRKNLHDAQEKSVLERLGKFLADSEDSNNAIHAFKEDQLAVREDRLASE
ncbi:MAG: hypothetical protein Q9206_001835 [Seirophora lacunosa]